MPQYTDDFRPLDTISGFSVRPGLYEEFGARLIPGGVSFTLHSQEAASCELLLFHHNESEPYAKIPIPLPDRECLFHHRVRLRHLGFGVCVQH